MKIVTYLAVHLKTTRRFIEVKGYTSIIVIKAKYIYSHLMILVESP